MGENLNQMPNPNELDRIKELSGINENWTTISNKDIIVNAARKRDEDDLVRGLLQLTKDSSVSRQLADIILELMN